jgi:hypothetical protein
MVREIAGSRAINAKVSLSGLLNPRGFVIADDDATAFPNIEEPPLSGRVSRSPRRVAFLQPKGILRA